MPTIAEANERQALSLKSQRYLVICDEAFAFGGETMMGSSQADVIKTTTLREWELGGLQWGA
jgi:hypothetical protein